MHGLVAVRALLIILLLVPSLESEAREPTVGEVQEEASRVLGYDRQDFAAWKQRARWAAALPRLQLGWQRDLTKVAKLSTRDSVSISGGDVTIGPDESDFDESFDEGDRFDVKAVWYLDELIFSRDSLAVASEQRDWVREKSKVLEEVTEAYFARRRLLEQPDGRESHEKRGLIDQMTARLDAHTGGWFSSQLAR